MLSLKKHGNPLFQRTIDDHTSAKIVLSNNFTFPPRFEMKFRIYVAPQNRAELIESE